MPTRHTATSGQLYYYLGGHEDVAMGQSTAPPLGLRVCGEWEVVNLSRGVGESPQRATVGRQLFLQKRRLQKHHGQQTHAVQYSLEYGEAVHWENGRHISGSTELSRLVQLRREMLEVLPECDGTQGAWNLGSTLIALFHQSGLVSHIEEAISVYRDFLNHHLHPHPNRDQQLSDLGDALQSLYRHSRAVSHLEEAVYMYCQALSLRSDPRPARHESLHSLGNGLLLLFGQTTSISRMEEAVCVLSEAASLRPHSHPERHWTLHLLGDGLVGLFKHNNSTSHIEEAIPVFREAVSLRPHPHPERHYSLAGLGSSLRILFQRAASISLIEEAVPVLRELVSLRPRPRPEHHWSLHELGYVLHKLFKYTKSISHLKEAIASDREELSLYQHPRPHRYWTLHNLGDSLYSMFTVTGSAGSLNEAISLLREILNSRTPPSFPIHECLYLSVQLLSEDRYGLSHSIRDLDEAIGHCQKLLTDHYLPRHARRSRGEHRAQTLLQKRFDMTGNQDNASEVVDPLQLISTLSLLFLNMRPFARSGDE